MDVIKIVQKLTKNPLVQKVYLWTMPRNHWALSTGTKNHLVVNRPYGKSDYIPCICWGRNARYAEHFKVGERCAIWGRIQSREYMKKLDEEHVEKRVAFEVSVSKLELLEEAQVQESIV